MRIGLVAVIWVVLIGGMIVYLHHRDIPDLAAGTAIELRTAEGNYVLEIITTFAVEPDPFALQVDQSEKPTALVVRLGGREILRRTDRLEAGTPIRVEPIVGVVEGTNEIYLEASPPLEQSAKSHAVRVRVLRDGRPVAEETFWSLPGGKVADIFRFVLVARQKKEDDHGHQ